MVPVGNISGIARNEMQKPVYSSVVDIALPLPCLVARLGDFVVLCSEMTSCASTNTMPCRRGSLGMSKLILVGTKVYLWLVLHRFETPRMSISLRLMADIGTSSGQWDEKKPTSDPDICKGNVVRDNVISTKVRCRAQHTQVEGATSIKRRAHNDASSACPVKVFSIYWRSQLQHSYPMSWVPIIAAGIYVVLGSGLVCLNCFRCPMFASSSLQTSSFSITVPSSHPPLFCLCNFFPSVQSTDRSNSLQ